MLFTLFFVDIDTARADFLQTGNHAQRGRFAAAGGTDKDHELLAFDSEIDILHGGHALPIASGVSLTDVFDDDF
jgi:hypothetical protein